MSGRWSGVPLSSPGLKPPSVLLGLSTGGAGPGHRGPGRVLTANLDTLIPDLDDAGSRGLERAAG